MALKKKGGQAFGAKKYTAAAELFTQALEACPPSPKVQAADLTAAEDVWRATLLTNRALARLKTEEAKPSVAAATWEAVLDDCRRASKLDADKWKALVKVAEAIVALKLVASADEASRVLERAQQLAPIDSGIRERCEQLRLAVAKVVYDHLEVGRRARVDSSLRTLRDLVDAAGEDEAAKRELRLTLDELQAEEQNRRGQVVPEHFFCPLSLCLFIEPVQTPAGISYEKGYIFEALARDNVDPLTRAPLKASALVPNLSLKAAVQAFVRANPWAHE